MKAKKGTSGTDELGIVITEGDGKRQSEGHDETLLPYCVPSRTLCSWAFICSQREA